MICFTGGEDTQMLVTFAMLLVPASLYGLGLVRGKTGYVLILSGLALHLAGIVLRGFETGAVPLAEKHDTISFMAFAMALVYLGAVRRKEMGNLDLLALPMVVFFMLVSFKYIPVNTVPPLQKTPWFFLHTFFYFISYGYFGVSACAGILYLTGRSDGYEVLQYSGTMYGWILFTLSLISGSIWFFVAYGTYWIWTPRELWSALTWFFYGLYMHARLMKGLRGRPASALGVAGFVVALFTYFGVGTIIPSPPTQF